MTDGNIRRDKIIKMLTSSSIPVSGGKLAKEFGVSRQVIVQDIALLRAENKNILSTYKGYIIEENNSNKKYTRSFHVKHTEEDIEDEYKHSSIGNRSTMEVPIKEIAVSHGKQNKIPGVRKKASIIKPTFAIVGAYDGIGDKGAKQKGDADARQSNSGVFLVVPSETLFPNAK